MRGGRGMGKTEFEVIPQIKRSAMTPTGKLFRYLKNHPTDTGIVEMVVSTLKIFWLPLAMEANGANSSELRSIALWAIGQLQNQINMIRLICLNEEPTQSVDISLLNTASNFARNDVPHSAIEVTPTPINSSFVNSEAEEEIEDEDVDNYNLDEFTDFSSIDFFKKS